MKLINCFLIFIFFSILSVSLASDFTSFCRRESTIIVAALNGKLFFVETETEPYSSLHSVSLGSEIYSSQRSDKFVGDYLDCNENWELCKYNETGLVKRLGNAQRFVGTSLLSEGTVDIMGSSVSTKFAVDTTNGILIVTDGSTYKMKEGLWITRNDYSFKGFDIDSKVQSNIWYVSFPEFVAECFCSKNLYTCKGNITVYRHRDQSIGYESTPALSAENMRRYRESPTFNNKVSSNYGVFVFVVVVGLSVSAYLCFSKTIRSEYCSISGINDKKEKQDFSLVSVDDENQENLTHKKQPANLVVNEDSDVASVEDKIQKGNVNIDDKKQIGDSISDANTVIGKITVTQKLLGTGSNGTRVFEGICDGRKVAVKKILCSAPDTGRKEIEILQKLDGHSNIVTYYHQESDRDQFLCLELCLCNLHDLISHYSAIFQNSSSSIALPETILNMKDFNLWKLDGFPTDKLLQLLRDVISAIMYIHDHGYVHRDLKPQNVLISKDLDLRAKISDMGISKLIMGDGSSLAQHTGGVGTLGWQAPEVLNNSIQSSAIDIFGFGLLMYFLPYKRETSFWGICQLGTQYQE